MKLVGDTTMSGLPRSWIDTFVANKAFEDHAMSMIVAMNEIRQEKKADEMAARERAFRYADTIRYIIGDKK